VILNPVIRHSSSKAIGILGRKGRPIW
jgi:hypothetical protein